VLGGEAIGEVDTEKAATLSVSCGRSTPKSV
jgi:hypothetical protein